MLFFNMRQTPKTFIFVILTAFALNSLGPLPGTWAQMISGEDFRLPAPGVMVRLSPPLDPPLLKGLRVHEEEPFRFDFILDKGDIESTSDQLRDESSRLIKYFLTGLTIPEKDLWVNLSPYEKERIIPSQFGLTTMGRDLLAEDYMLKQITASLIYPEGAIGKKFWDRIYAEAQRKYGTTNIPVNTFNKVWIVPEKAVVYENPKAQTAYVVEARLKVMLEEDYLALTKHQTLTRGDLKGDSPLLNNVKGTVPFKVSPSTLPSEIGLNVKATQGTKGYGANDASTLGSQILREIVLPQLTREVNENKNFSKLRQVYYSLILATWYKNKIKDSILNQVYADKNKVVGVQYASTVIPAKAGIHYKNDVEGLYQEYLKAFKKGVYNYIKEERDTLTQEMIPRKYFSGGTNLAMTVGGVLQPVHHMDAAMEASTDKLVEVQSGVAIAGSSNGKNLSPKNLTQDEALKDLSKLVNGFAEEAYNTVWKKIQAITGNYRKIWNFVEPTIMYRQATCSLVVPEFLQRFSNKEFKAYEVINDALDTGDFPDTTTHSFIIVFYNNDVWLVDPTYQQLVPSSHQDPTRKVLIVRLLDIFKTAEDMGIPGGAKVWVDGLGQEGKSDPKFLNEIRRVPDYEKFLMTGPGNPIASVAPPGPGDRAMVGDKDFYKIMEDARKEKRTPLFVFRQGIFEETDKGTYLSYLLEQRAQELGVPVDKLLSGEHPLDDKWQAMNKNAEIVEITQDDLKDDESFKVWQQKQSWGNGVQAIFAPRTRLVGGKVQKLTENQRQIIASITGHYAETMDELVEAQLNAVSNFDDLTTLPTRKASPMLFKQFIMNNRGVTSKAVIMLDIDHFKRINDCFSHGVGDQVLRAVGQFIRENFKTRELVGFDAFRYGGEEIVIFAHFNGGSVKEAQEGLEAFFKRLQHQVYKFVGALNNREKILEDFQAKANAETKKKRYDGLIGQLAVQNSKKEDDLKKELPTLQDVINAIKNDKYKFEGWQITASVGVNWIQPKTSRQPRDDTERNEWIERQRGPVIQIADAMMYEAKTSGRNGLRFFERPVNFGPDTGTLEGLMDFPEMPRTRIRASDSAMSSPLTDFKIHEEEGITDQYPPVSSGAEALLTVIEDLKRVINLREFIQILRNISGDQGLDRQDFFKDVYVSYYSWGTQKYVFKVRLTKTSGSVIEFLLAAKKGKDLSDIRSIELRDLTALKGRNVPRFGGFFMASDGRLWYLEEFIKGDTFEQLIEKRHPMEGLIRKMIRVLFQIAKDLGGSMPGDNKDSNFIVRERAESEDVIMVDLGEERLSVLGGQAIFLDQVSLLKNLLAWYGSPKPADNFPILDEVIRHLSQDGQTEFVKKLKEYLDEQGRKEAVNYQKSVTENWKRFSWSQTSPRDWIIYVMSESLDYYLKHKESEPQGDSGDRAQLSTNQAKSNTGGIDLTPANMNLQTKLDSRFRGNDNGIKLHLDPAQLAELKNAPGFVPVVINIFPMRDLRAFLDSEHQRVSGMRTRQEHSGMTMTN